MSLLGHSNFNFEKNLCETICNRNQNLCLKKIKRKYKCTDKLQCFSWDTILLPVLVNDQTLFFQIVNAFHILQLANTGIS